MSCLRGAFGTLVSRLRVAIAVARGQYHVSVTASQSAAIEFKTGLDAAQPRPYLNEPSFSRARTQRGPGQPGDRPRCRRATPGPTTSAPASSMQIGRAHV